ncbi:MAG: carboxypeptidase regulatory-like domain-containing protein [Candidatus Pseudobacter hemicellulosilyticus]|uniref:Carboxypeptidase regulatory-like domain-containing protein n=1 Tax=Candidatus Pseudobacter hemicellulosilyticus TaxID=3121375 RepID=A0AAJ5WYB1_9BACT|nr:MAG: carboxypeptidase regulatory-like domain-containing protein [Pseudobacter sp.]
MKKSAVLIALCISLLSGACGKTDTISQDNIDVNDTTKPADPSSTASITGRIYPVSVVNTTSISATNTQSQTIYNARPDANGYFKIRNLPAGPYQVSFTTDPAYGPPDPHSLTLLKGQSTDLGIIEFTSGAAMNTASISGIVHPVSAVQSIFAVLTSDNSAGYQAELDPLSGAFSIKKLPAGDYRISMSKSIGYLSDVDVPFTVTVKRDQSLNVGRINFFADSDPQSPNYISYEFDGTTHLRKTSVGSKYNSPDLHMFNTSSYNSITIPSGPKKPEPVIMHSLEILLDEVNGPGTYICKGASKSQVRLSMRTVFSRYAPLLTWSSAGSGGSATITITTIDPEKRTMSGYFSAEIVPESSTATGNKTVSNGVFSKLKY